MTIKEITTLRKSGHLQEALKAAESKFSKVTDVYTVGALFWCLNDLYKQQSREEALLTIERMQSLYDEYCSGDEYMSKSLEIAHNKMLKNYDLVKEAVAKAKAGEKPKEQYSKILKIFQSSDLDISLFNDFGWVIYYTLKHTAPNDVLTRKQLLHQYFKLQLPRPALLHSLMLVEGIKVEENTPLQFRIRDFIRLWGLDNLMEDDWKQFQTDEGHIMPSNVEKLIKVYAKEVKTDNITASEEFNFLIDKALSRFSNNQNLPYYKAIVLISQGKREAALEYYKKLILKSPSKQYLWNQITDLTDDLDTKIGLLSKALCLGQEEAFLGGIRLKMAKLLLQKGLPENAKHELRTYQKTYESKGWSLKQEFRDLQNQVSNVMPTDSNKDIYSYYSRIAEDFIYSEIPSILAIKVSERILDDNNRPGKRFVQWILRTKNNTLYLKKPWRFGLPKCSNGVRFDVKVYDGKIVWIKINQSLSIKADWIKKVSGKITLRTDRNGKPYAILDGVYIGASLLTNVLSGQSIKVIAVIQKDGRWSAVALYRI